MLGRAIDTPSDSPTSPAPGTPLYVHLPFCAAKCRYCDFFSVAGKGQDIDAMLAAILREAETWAPRGPRTVFLGGGTPSLLSIEQLRAFLDGLDRITGFRRSAQEVTAECNPESLDRDKASALLDLGVRRLSIGFQTLSDDMLERFGRVHTVDQSFKAFESARSAGVADINVDLIYAYPGQTVAQWGADLSRILALRSDHLSAYNLTFEEETVFRRWLDQGRIQKASEELELELFDVVRERTRAAGYVAYEISNYARDGRACAHNLNYWRNGPYLGIGPSAVSRTEFTRRGNIKAIAGYTAAIRDRGHATLWSETPAPAARLGETWWLGLRLAEGLTADEARGRAGFPPDSPDPALAIAHRLAELELIESTAGRWRLTARGIPLADYVGREFLALGLATAS